jgi:hypothetical protein
VINWVIDLIGDLPILCQHRFLTRKLLTDTRLHCDPDHPKPIEGVRSRPIPTLLIPEIHHAKVETFLQPGRATPDPSPLRVGEKSSLNRV